ncbi:MAG: type II secretion system protein [Phycisphaerales bacterium]|nr:type II secretion system protein [Phycisphaerales bacterium]
MLSTTSARRAMFRSAGAPRGFTIVELLVVIGVIAILSSLILAGLSGAMRTAAKTRELNSLRQVFQAWTIYSSNYNDYFMPAHLDENTQTKWGVTYRDRGGNVLPAAQCVGYGWRLAGYLDYELDPLLGYLSTRVLEWDADPANIATLRGQVADRPAFGLNSFFVGGWWTNSSPDGTPSMLFDDAPIPGLIARTAGSLARASEQIVFASSTLRPPGTHKSVQGDEETSGSPYVDAPLLPTGQAWAPALGDPSSVVVTGGAHSTPFARYNRTVATCTGDGGTSGISLRDVSDMRRWTNPATGPEWNYGN